jgi:hypothetical protein
MIAPEHRVYRRDATGRIVQNNRSKSACTLNARKRLNNQAVWPVIFDITGPICARALKTKIPLTLGPRGHHDWPVMSIYRTSAPFPWGFGKHIATYRYPSHQIPNRQGHSTMASLSRFTTVDTTVEIELYRRGSWYPIGFAVNALSDASY